MPAIAQAGVIDPFLWLSTFFSPVSEVKTQAFVIDPFLWLSHFFSLQLTIPGCKNDRLSFQWFVLIRTKMFNLHQKIHTITTIISASMVKIVILLAKKLPLGQYYQAWNVNWSNIGIWWNCESRKERNYTMNNHTKLFYKCFSIWEHPPEWSKGFLCMTITFKMHEIELVDSYPNYGIF